MASTSPSTQKVFPSDIVNDRDRGALVIVTAALCMAFSLLFYLARLVSRWPWKRLLGRDDAVTGAALVCAITAFHSLYMLTTLKFFSLVQSTLVSADVPAGLGKTRDDLSPPAAVAVVKVYYASDMLFVVSMCLSRLAIGLLFLRLSSHQRHLRAALVIMSACILHGFTSLLLLGIRDPAVIPRGIFDRWIAVAVLGNIIDGSMVIFPIFLVHGLHLRRSAKITVIAGFAMRLPLIAFSTLQLTSLSRTLSSVDYTLVLADVQIWRQLEMHYNVVAATVPCLRVFLRAFHTQQLTHMISIDDDSMILSNANDYGQARTPLSSTIASAFRGNTEIGNTNLELWASESTVLGYGKTESSAMRNETRNNPSENVSIASDASETATVVRQTIDVRYADD